MMLRTQEPADQHLPRRSSGMRHHASTSIFRFTLCALPFAISLASCAKPVPEHRGRNNDILAESSAGRIEAVMSSAVPIPATRAAAEQALRARGYVITETFGTDDRAKIEAAGTGAKRDDRTTIETWRSESGTRIRVDVGLFGDTAAARSILDETIARLGR